jgi:hypothetical protein
VLPGGEPLRGVIARLLEPSPARRFATARAAREALLRGPLEPGTAVVAARDASVRATLALDQAPRELTGAAAERFELLAHSPWQLMDPTHPTAREDNDWGWFDITTLVFFSVLTAGVLPLVFIGIARNRRRRLRKFFRDGHPAEARVVDFKEEELAFDVKLTRVRYEFTADGALRRGSDLVLPPIADRWRAGDRIEVLYLPERGYDSVIVSVE